MDLGANTANFRKEEFGCLFSFFLQKNNFRIHNPKFSGCEFGFFFCKKKCTYFFSKVRHVGSQVHQKIFTSARIPSDKKNIRFFAWLCLYSAAKKKLRKFWPKITILVVFMNKTQISLCSLDNDSKDRSACELFRICNDSRLWRDISRRDQSDLLWARFRNCRRQGELLIIRACAATYAVARWSGRARSCRAAAFNKAAV